MSPCGLFSNHSRIECNYRGGLYLKGTIVCVNLDGSYNIRYVADFTLDVNVSGHFIRGCTEGEITNYTSLYHVEDTVEVNVHNNGVFIASIISYVHTDNTYDVVTVQERTIFTRVPLELIRSYHALITSNIVPASDSSIVISGTETDIIPLPLTTVIEPLVTCPEVGMAPSSTESIPLPLTTVTEPPSVTSMTCPSIEASSSISTESLLGYHINDTFQISEGGILRQARIVGINLVENTFIIKLEDLLPPLYQVSDLIEASYQGLNRWYPGRIGSVNRNGTFNINYDDGDSEDNVSSHFIRYRVNAGVTNSYSGQGFQMNERIEGNYKNYGEYYPGIISAVNIDGTYDIIYDDGDVETSIAVNRIRSPLSYGLTNINNVVDNEPVVAIRQYQMNDTIQGNWQSRGRWYNGIILNVNEDGTYSVSYVDNDIEDRVTASCLRPRIIAPLVEPHRLMYQINERIEARFRQQYVYYPGIITCVNTDGTYSIRFDDGDLDVLSGEYIRPLIVHVDGSEISFQTGDSIEGNYKGLGIWYTGYIDSVLGNGCYNIRYDDGDSESSVTGVNIRRRQT